MNLKTAKSRHHPYDAQRNGMNVDAASSGAGSSPSQSGTPGPIRRRISRACDQCNQLRTKCDGKLPCQHCIDFTLKCEYARERKKRGKASRKDIQAAAAAAAAAASCSSTTSTSPTGTSRVLNGASRPELPLAPVPGSVREGSTASSSSRTSIGDIHDINNGQIHHHHIHQHHHHHLPTPDSPSHLQMHHQQNISHDGMPMGYDRMSSFQHQLQSPNTVVGGPRMLPQPMHTSSNTGPNGYGGEYTILSPHHETHPMGSLPPSAPSPLSSLLGNSPDAGSPSWLSMPSPPQPILSSNVGVRYPVLLPLLPHINSIIPAMLACDLLDLYFTNPSTAFFQPASPYVLAHIFRKRSFLHPTSPRPTSPALLCAMLWVAAQTCDATFLTAPPSARGRVCQRLLELCIRLLRPLVHVNIGSSQHSYSANNETGGMGIGLGGLGGGGGSGREGVGAAGTLDDVLTYIHLGIVISTSDFKTASLRWWNTAWALARELRLNRELPPPEMELAPEQEEEKHHSPADSDSGNNNHPTAAVSEEEKEERRRTWWLLYIMDRHLALCYNRPLALLDIECENLYLPIDEVSWQNGDFYPEPHAQHIYQHGSPSAMVLPGINNRQRTTGPTFEIIGTGLFDYFLPLMTILGEVVDLHHARNRPRFGVPSDVGLGSALWTTTPGNEFEERMKEIANHLDAYELSLRNYEIANCTSDSSPNPATSPTATTSQPANVGQAHGMSEAEMQNRVVLSYGTHVMHVLHILLVGKWDPVSMLDDNDLWISSPGFLSATAHAVSAAEAISNIVKYDPDLSFMPYFFGIYLLQGSFLLLLIADKLQGEASEAVITACETIVRAHEVCIVTLNTEYQRNLRKVMRSALSQVRGRGLPEDMEEQKLRRREVLQLYRWCGDGTGLAL
ncbi:fungal-specific transcription factor domain-containing protein [Terfezia claveryi]|nr:fungal-specific transcription factor domain-containing protein [Terfezia claveryi]